MKKAIRYSLKAVIALCLIYAIYLAIGFGVHRMACGTEEKLAIAEMSGFRFEVIYLSCDTLAKDEEIRVYAETTASDQAWFLRNWRSKRTLLFRYDPGRPDNPLPSITHPSQSTILISIPEVSSIEYQSREWEKMSVDYAIGRVDYPTAPK